MNCGRCSNEKKRTVIVALLSQRRYFLIPAVSGHQTGIEGFLEFLEIFAPAGFDCLKGNVASYG
ncbi:hypothetical protein RchiOBHm_Chr5g0052161 [Rosa chinensis]|uniref:Uncharacterized protein n=1 Tax=Rosa chinensis TaxID=74649 RepID=A0A2P6QFL6_ROSCH|nr:hypothetical protein RchiOBHm_Chr5g0052161 [Rosa chinensis]